MRTPNWVACLAAGILLFVWTACGDEDGDEGGEVVTALDCLEQAPHQVGGECVVCTEDGHCPLDQNCSTETHQCVCPDEKPNWDETGCRQCLKNKHCEEGSHCRPGLGSLHNHHIRHLWRRRPDRTSTWANTGRHRPPGSRVGDGRTLVYRGQDRVRHRRKRRGPGRHRPVCVCSCLRRAVDVATGDNDSSR